MRRLVTTLVYVANASPAYRSTTPFGVVDPSTPFVVMRSISQRLAAAASARASSTRPRRRWGLSFCRIAARRDVGDVGMGVEDVGVGGCGGCGEHRVGNARRASHVERGPGPVPRGSLERILVRHRGVLSLEPRNLLAYEGVVRGRVARLSRFFRPFRGPRRREVGVVRRVWVDGVRVAVAAPPEFLGGFPQLRVRGVGAHRDAHGRVEEGRERPRGELEAGAVGGPLLGGAWSARGGEALGEAWSSRGRRVAAGGRARARAGRRPSGGPRTRRSGRWRCPQRGGRRAPSPRDATGSAGSRRAPSSSRRRARAVDVTARDGVDVGRRVASRPPRLGGRGVAHV